MQSSNNPVAKLWNLFRGGNKPSKDGSLRGSQRPLSVGTRYAKQYLLEIPIQPLRPINGSLDYSYELIEMATWSYEIRHALSFLARDAFQQIDGRVESWRVAETLKDGTPVNKDVLEIAKDLQERYNGKQLVLGGNRLQRAAREVLAYGDCFVELAIEKEGIGRNDYGISKSLYLPPMSVFVEEDDHGELSEYVQRKTSRPTRDDIHISPIKVLHFSYETQGLYGNPLTFQCLESWRKLKACSADLEEAARAVGVSPWLHIMPEDRDESYKQAYADEFESLQSDGLITHLYLMHGADVRKASSGNTSLDDLIKYWLQLRYQMVPAGLALWFFPGLGIEGNSGKEIANQPALVYARLIAYIRSVLGEQIKWAINTELVCKKGFDWFVENGKYDILWGEWFVSGLESDLMTGEAMEDDKADPSKGNQKENKKDDKGDEESEERAKRLIEDAQSIIENPSETDLKAIWVMVPSATWLLNNARLSDKTKNALKIVVQALRSAESLIKKRTNE